MKGDEAARLVAQLKAKVRETRRVCRAPCGQAFRTETVHALLVDMTAILSVLETELRYPSDDGGAIEEQ